MTSLDWGMAFRILRHARGESQEAFAKKLDVVAETLSRVETGERAPSYAVWTRLCEIERIPPVLLVLLASPPADLAQLDPGLLGILAKELLTHIARSGHGARDVAPESARDTGAK